MGRYIRRSSRAAFCGQLELLLDGSVAAEDFDFPACFAEPITGEVFNPISEPRVKTPTLLKGLRGCTRHRRTAKGLRGAR